MTGGRRDDGTDIRSLARPLRDDADFDALVDRVGDARLVLIGEASHGTHEFYAWRDRLTRRLVTDRGFTFVAVEGDWPDCRRLHRWVVGDPDGPPDVDTALRGYDRWPTWMWANTAVRAATTWLHEHNRGRPAPEQVGFHGLDVYSLQRSIREVVGWLRDNEPDLADAAVEAYGCFEPYGRDPFEYARATRWVPESCEDRVVEMLRTMCERHATDAAGDPDERFVAEQNAAVVAGAERYYRSAVRGGPSSWNVRDTHMAETLDRLLTHAGRDMNGQAKAPAKGVVWAHNTHVGDASATDMADAGMTNLGKLARERYGRDEVVLVGLAGHRGSVIAGDDWGAPAERLPVPPGRAGSAEDRLHAALGDQESLLVFPQADDQPPWLRTPLDHRAIGVVYRPEREKWGNYVPSTLGERYDAMLWFGETSALEPLRAEPPDDPEPETAPSGE
jgi:erythromycin esterase